MRTGHRPWAGCVLAALAACSPDPPSPVYATASSTLVRTPDGTALWLTSPDDNTVVAVDPQSLAVTRSVSVAGTPTQLALVGQRLVVTLAQSTDVAVVNPLVTPATVTRVPVPCGGTRAVVAMADAVHAIVACPHDDTLVQLDAVAGTVTRVVASPGRPTALAITGSVLTVTASRVGELRALSLATWSPVPTDTVPLVTTPGIAATQTDALAAEPTGGHVFAAFNRVDHDSNRDLPPEAGGYGTVLGGTPRIEPRVFAACGTRYARFDGGPLASSGPSALAYDAVHHRLWVVGLYTDSVLTLACPVPAAFPDTGRYLGSQAHPATDTTPLTAVASFSVGRAPRGIVLSPDGTTAWVDEGFDHAVARLTLPTDGATGTTINTVRLAPTLELRRAVGATSLSATALAGRSLFYDAANPHLTPGGVLTCGTCHPGEGEDGLRWFLHTATVPRKLRRTPPAWGARADVTALHWDGAFHDAATLTDSTIRALLQGDGLLVDTRAIATFLAEAPAPPPRPLTALDPASATRGMALFQSATVGCARCHAGPRFADNQVHAVVPPSTDPDGVLSGVRTPTLVAVRTRPPYLHDGRAPDLMSVLTTHNPGDTHGVTSGLSPADLADLVMYLTSL